MDKKELQNEYEQGLCYVDIFGDMYCVCEYDYDRPRPEDLLRQQLDAHIDSLPNAKPNTQKET